MRKSAKTIKIVTGELERTGLISQACAKAKIPRSTYYRWYNSDLDFQKAADTAIEIGRANMSDFAESVVFKNMQNGSQRAAEYYLRNNDDRYRNASGRDMKHYKDQLDARYEDAFDRLRLIKSGILMMVKPEILDSLEHKDGDISLKQNPNIETRKLNEKEIRREVEKVLGEQITSAILNKLMQTDDLRDKLIKWTEVRDNTTNPGDS